MLVCFVAVMFPGDSIIGIVVLFKGCISFNELDHYEEQYFGHMPSQFVEELRCMFDDQTWKEIISKFDRRTHFQQYHCHAANVMTCLQKMFRLNSDFPEISYLRKLVSNKIHFQSCDLTCPCTSQSKVGVAGCSRWF